MEAGLSEEDIESIVSLLECVVLSDEENVIRKYGKYIRFRECFTLRKKIVLCKTKIEYLSEMKSMCLRKP